MATQRHPHQLTAYRDIPVIRDVTVTPGTAELRSGTNGDSFYAVGIDPGRTEPAPTIRRRPRRRATPQLRVDIPITISASQVDAQLALEPEHDPGVIAAVQRQLEGQWLRYAAQRRALDRADDALYRQMFGDSLGDVASQTVSTEDAPLTATQVRQQISRAQAVVDRYRQDVLAQLEAASAQSADPQAHSRARALLRSLLTPEQWERYERTGIVIETVDRHDYYLRAGGMILVYLPMPGRAIGTLIERWCAHPADYDEDGRVLPATDLLIGQLLHLRADPAALRRAANVYPAGKSWLFERLREAI